MMIKDTLQNFVTEHGPLPDTAAGTSDIRAARRRWMAALSRPIVERKQQGKWGGPEAETLFHFLDEQLNAANVSDDEDASLRDYFSTLSNEPILLPADVPNQLYSFAEGFQKKYGEIKKPSWCARNYRSLYLAALIAGAGGHRFIFGLHAYADASSHSSHRLGVGSVQGFIAAAQTHFITTIKKGKPNGRSSVYQLSQSADYDLWRNLDKLLVKQPNVKIDSAEMILKAMPWIQYDPYSYHPESDNPDNY